MKYEINKSRLLFALLIVFFITPQSFAASTATIFYLDENWHPVVKLERLGPISDGMQAILAMYTLQNGAGCTSYGSGDKLRCLLTESLNVGGQCSSKHINLIRSWFKENIPPMSVYDEGMYKNIHKSEHLEAICYCSPEGALVQHLWDRISITTNNNHVTVDAHGGSAFRTETESFRYITEYKINENSVTVISHKKIPSVRKK